MNTVKKFDILNFIIFALVILYFNFTAKFDFYDDVYAINTTLTWSTLVDSYLYWSGRVIALVFQIFMLQHQPIFRIANSIIMIGMPVLTWILLDKSKKISNLTLIVFGFLLYDYKEMTTAGLVTTYVTYYWSLFANILFYIILRHYLNGRKFLSVYLILALVLGIIACNSEIGSLVNTFILFAILTVNYFRLKTVNRKLLLLLTVPLSSILFFLTCPGMHIRSISETYSWLPEFSSYTTIYKSYLGFSETLFYYFSTRSFIFMLFLGALIGVAVIKGINVTYLVFFSLVCFVFPRYTNGLIIKFSNVSSLKAYLFFIALLGFSFFVIFTICRIFKDKANVLLFICFILLLGMVSRVVMGFSPTIYVSSTRTFLYCDFALIIAVFSILKNSETNLTESCPVLLAIFAYPYFISNLFPEVNREIFSSVWLSHE